MGLFSLPGPLGLAVSFAAGLAAGLAGCSATWPTVIDPSDIVDIREGRPRISRVRDLGAVHIGHPGPLLAESDGQFAVGELLLIEGSGFGKQPTVGIAGRPVEIRWRTAGGGIVAQIPAGSSIGQEQVWVQSEGGRTEAPLLLERLAMVLDSRRGQLHTLRVGRAASGAPTVVSGGEPLLVAGARAMAMSADGAAAYVLADDAAGSSVAIVDLVAPGGPRITETRPLRYRGQTILAAEQAGVLAILGGEQLTIWDIREARRPATWPMAPLPESSQKPRAAALSPNGEILALALPEGNQLALLNVKPGQTSVVPRQLALLRVLPGLRQPLVQGLRFATDGATLWLSAGDNPDSLAAGHQPTRIIAVEIKNPAAAGGESSSSAAPPDIGVAVLKTVDLRDAGAPGQLALAKSPPLGAGTTIRTAPEKATIFLTTVSEGGKAARSSLWRSDLLGQITPLYSGKELLAGLDVSSDARLAVTARVSGSTLSRSLTVTDLVTNAATTLPLGPADDADLSTPQHSHLQILLQP